jgi:ABC-type Mn2+/Zn2+ transport system ATPase subunit
LIALERVEIGYGRAPLLGALTFEVGAGDFWGVVGPNGGGKTTLVKTLIGIIPPVRGEVRFAAGTPRFGYVPQRHVVPANYPLTAFDVALMGRYSSSIGSRPAAADRRRALEELERIEMGKQAFVPFDALSGGQKQRVLLARALLAEPEVLVLDEPTTGMDLPGESAILAVLRRLHAERGITILMIGHHISSVVSVADHLCLINRDAGLFAAGPRDEMLSPERLSELYGRPIAVEPTPGGFHVHSAQRFGDG